MAAEKSFIYKRKINGPNIEPWGTWNIIQDKNFSRRPIRENLFSSTSRSSNQISWTSQRKAPPHTLPCQDYLNTFHETSNNSFRRSTRAEFILMFSNNIKFVQKKENLFVYNGLNNFAYSIRDCDWPIIINSASSFLCTGINFLIFNLSG